MQAHAASTSKVARGLQLSSDLGQVSAGQDQTLTVILKLTIAPLLTKLSMSSTTPTLRLFITGSAMQIRAVRFYRKRDEDSA